MKIAELRTMGNLLFCCFGIQSNPSKDAVASQPENDNRGKTKQVVQRSENSPAAVTTISSPEVTNEGDTHRTTSPDNIEIESHFSESSPLLFTQESETEIQPSAPPVEATPDTQNERTSFSRGVHRVQVQASAPPIEETPDTQKERTSSSSGVCRVQVQASAPPAEATPNKQNKRTSSSSGVHRVQVQPSAPPAEAAPDKQNERTSSSSVVYRVLVQPSAPPVKATPTRQNQSTSPSSGVHRVRVQPSAVPVKVTPDRSNERTSSSGVSKAKVQAAVSSTPDKTEASKKCSYVRSLNPGVDQFNSLYPEIFLSPDEEDVCPTCLEEYDLENPKIKTECNHHFHLGCIYAWMERSTSCPCCFKVMVFNEAA